MCRSRMALRQGSNGSLVLPDNVAAAQAELVVATSRFCQQPTKRSSCAAASPLASAVFVASKVSPKKKKAKVPKKAGATKAKVVRFAPPDKIVSVTNRHNLVQPEDMPQAWYQPEDYVHIKLDILTSIQAIGSFFSTEVNDEVNDTVAPPTLDLSEHCLRGIETGISNEIYQRRKIRIHTTTQSVLEQQRIFRCLGVESDPYILRAISTLCSKSALESARAVAQLDAAP